MTTAHPLLRRIGRALVRGLRLRCPRCGAATLFRGAFAMHESCNGCALKFEREPGYFIGAIYINYAATAVLSITGFFLLDAYASISLTSQLVLWSAFCIGFPLWFFRYSKSLWLAIDFLFTPEPPPLHVIHRRAV
jgi:uncharacterized protein (DUF983 family)